MATILRPAATRAIAVQTKQPLALESDVATNWWKRNQTTSEAWTQLNGGGVVSALVWTTPGSVTNRLTFDRVQIKASDLQPTDDAGALDLNLVEGPVAVLWATGRIANEAMEEPTLRPWEGEDDDPALGLPLVMPGANRDDMGTVLCGLPRGRHAERERGPPSVLPWAACCVGSVGWGAAGAPQ